MKNATLDQKSNGNGASNAKGTKNDVVKAATPSAEKKEAKETKLIPIVTPADRFAKANQFHKLQLRYEYLKTKEEELAGFTFGNDGMTSEIYLKHSNGEIKIGNPDIMKKVVDMCKKELDNLIDQAEEEVLNFNI